jgi:electron transfer flavoprotein alpha subunit
MILVFVEPEGDDLAVLSQEALTFARATAAATGSGSTAIHAVAADPLSPAALQTLAAHGVGVLHLARDERLAAFSAPAWAAAVVGAARAVSAFVVLAGASPRGNEVLAHVGARLDQRMAANVTSVESGSTAGGSATLVVRRQVMGGSALEELTLDGAPALLTLAGHAVEPVTVDRPIQPTEVAEFTPALTEADLVARVRRTVPVAMGGADLTKARVVVGGGRGVGGPDRFDPLVELAEQLGGALGVSRVVTSLSWRPHHEQVGQTGSRITPEVYLACGISGAIQHWAGCASSKTIIAVNTDPEAPMVTKAHYAVIGDLHEVVPAIIAELAARNG